MKKIILFILFSISVFGQVSPPSGYTPNYGIRMWSQGANPSADSLNANWMLIDSKIRMSYDSAMTNSLKTYGNYNIYGNRYYKSGSLVMDGSRLLFGSNALTSSPSIGEIMPTSGRTYLTYTNNTRTDTLATQNWVRSNYQTQSYNYRILWSDASTNNSGTASMTEYQYANATSTVEATTYNIKIPFYKIGDEDSLICYFRAYYFLGTGNDANQIRVRLYVDGDPPFADGYYGQQVDITSDDSYGYANYVLRANISSFPAGSYYLLLAGSIDLDTYSSGVSKIFISRPIFVVRY